MTWFWNLFCRHKRMTFPMTPRGRRTGAYVVCLDCGREWNYDVESMMKGAERVAKNEDRWADSWTANRGRREVPGGV